MRNQTRTSKILKIGTRGSPLALVQAGKVAVLLKKKFPSLKIRIKKITTSGDKGKIRNVRKNGYAGKGLFVKEIEEALLSREIDIAVHSLKDVPAILPQGLKLGAYLKRENPADLFISKKWRSLSELPSGACLGTSSPRRTAQVLSKRPNIQVRPMRGNVGTRIEKLKNGEFDAIILAVAGIKRLKLFPVLKKYNKSVLDFVPGVGQGIICLEIRSGDLGTKQLIRSINHKNTEMLALAERNFLQTIGGDCDTPIGALAKTAGNKIHLTGFAASPDGKKILKKSFSGKDPFEISAKLAGDFINSGVRKLIGLKEKKILYTGLTCDRTKFPGCKIIHKPFIKIVPPSDGGKSLNEAIKNIQKFDWLIFTSKNAVEYFFNFLQKNSTPSDSPFRRKAGGQVKGGGLKIAAVGDATAALINEYGYKVALVPTGEYNSASLAKEFQKINISGKKILFPRAEDGKDTLVRSLKKQGATVALVNAYRTIFKKVTRKQIGKPDQIIFTSRSTYKSYLESFGRNFFGAEVIFQRHFHC